jgi:hypothetical protein
MRVETTRCSLDATKWNPGLFKAAGNSRITLRFIQATAMRSTSARGVSKKDTYWGLPFLHEQKQIHRE